MKRFNSPYIWASLRFLLAALFLSINLSARSQGLSPLLIQEATISGEIMDVSADRILHKTSSGAVYIRNRQTDQDELIDTTGTTKIIRGHLTPLGAILVGGIGGDYYPLYEWKANQLTRLDSTPLQDSVQVKGRYAIWNQARGLFRRDLLAGKHTLVVQSWFYWDYFSSTPLGSLAENGDVVYSYYQHQGIYRWRNGVTAQWNSDPATLQEFLRVPNMKGNYKLNNGWVLYQNNGTWLRSPGGVEKEIPLSGDPYSNGLVDLSSDGQALVFNENKLYLFKFDDGTLQQLGPYSRPGEYYPHFVETYWKDGYWQIVYYNSQTGASTLYRVDTAQAAPLAFGQYLTAWKDTPLSVTLQSDHPSTDLTYILTAPAHGSLTGTAPNLTYQPDPGYEGPDSFTYQVNDGVTASAPATVSFNVTAPLLEIGSATIRAGEKVSLPIQLLPGAGTVAGVDFTLAAYNKQYNPRTYNSTDHLQKNLIGPPRLADATAGWQVVQDPYNPWKMSLVNITGVAGPVPLVWIDFLDTRPLTASPVMLSIFEGNVSNELGDVRPLPGNVIDGQLTVLPALVYTTAGSAIVEQDQTVEIPIGITEEVKSATQLTIRLGAYQTGSIEKYPPLGFLDPMFRLADENSGWTLQQSTASSPWTATLTRSTPINGPLPLLYFRFRVASNSSLGLYTTLSTSMSSINHQPKPEIWHNSATLEVVGCHEREKGDINGDGQIGIGDAVLALRMALSIGTFNSCQKEAANVNCDQTVNIGDAIRILRKIAMNEEFPACSG